LDNASSSTAFTPAKQTEVLQCIILQPQSEFSNQPRINMQTSDPCPGLKYSVCVLHLYSSTNAKLFAFYLEKLNKNLLQTREAVLYVQFICKVYI